MSKLVQRDMTIEMWNFLSTMVVANDSNVVNSGNVIDETETYISKWYTPQLRVSNATRELLDSLGVMGLIANNEDMGEDSLTYNLLKSNLKDKDLKTYNLFKSVIADLYAFTYAFSDNTEFLKYVNREDITRTINNVMYLIDYFSDSNDNAQLLKELTDTAALLGVLKNGLDTMKQEVSDSVSG